MFNFDHSNHEITNKQMKFKAKGISNFSFAMVEKQGNKNRLSQGVQLKQAVIRPSNSFVAK